MRSTVNGSDTRHNSAKLCTLWLTLGGTTVSETHQWNGVTPDPTGVGVIKYTLF